MKAQILCGTVSFFLQKIDKYKQLMLYPVTELWYNVCANIFLHSIRARLAEIGPVFP